MSAVTAALGSARVASGPEIEKQVPSRGFSRVLAQALPENHAATLRAPIGSSRIPVLPPQHTGSASVPAPDRSLGSALGRALQAETRVDALIAAVAGGRTFSAGELIALQATVFRYSQTVEVISRGVDRLIGAVKQTLGTQV